MSSTPPRTPCNRSQALPSIRGEETSPPIRGEETSPSQDDPSSSESNFNLSISSTNTNESHDNKDKEIQRAQETIEACYCHRPMLGNPIFSLDEQSYENLRQNLGKVNGLLQYFDEEVRSDWDPETGKLTLRVMPTCIHEVTEVRLTQIIWNELDRVAKKCDDLRKDREMLLMSGHSSLSDDFKKASSYHTSPDGQIAYRGLDGSPFVIEIAYSQTKEDLETKITQCFRHTSSVCTILVIDIDYPKPWQNRLAPYYKHRAAVPLWTAERSDENIDVECHKNEHFRLHNGRVPRGQLAIPFKIFLPPEKRTNKAVQNEELVISYRALADVIEMAEDRQRLWDQSSQDLSPEDRSSQEPPLKRPRLRIRNKNGDFEEVILPEVKRRKIDPSHEVLPDRTRSRTRSRITPAHQSRRSSRLSSPQRLPQDE